MLLIFYFAWFLLKNPEKLYKNNIFLHFLADFGPHFDPKFAQNLLKKALSSHESHQDFLERYGKPLLLIIYLSLYCNCWKLSPKGLFFSFSAVFGTDFDPKILEKSQLIKPMEIFIFALKITLIKYDDVLYTTTITKVKNNL